MPLDSVIDPLVNDGVLDREIEDIEQTKTEVDPRYKGKSTEDVIRMHQEAEKALSRQGQTLGEQRKILDKLVEMQLAEKSVPEQPVQIDPTDLFQDPTTSINQAVANSPVAKKLEQNTSRLDQMERSMEHGKFAQRHPDIAETLVDPAFQAWVQGSQYRLRLIQKLDSYDFAAGDDLFELWNEHKTYAGVQAKKDAAAERRATQLNQARTEGSSSGSDVKPKKIFNRLEVGRLMTMAKAGDKEASLKFNNPTFQQELREAYMEDRVR